MSLTTQTEDDLALIPDECIVRALVLLEDVADIKRFQATCKRFRDLGQEPEIWKQRLRKDFDVVVKTNDLALLAGLYKSVATEISHFMRFRGVFTDGGVDMELPSYWVDNLFKATSWNHMCSALGHNVNCIGLLTGDWRDGHEPLAERAKRDYLIERLLFYYWIMGNPMNLIHARPSDFGSADRSKTRAELAESPTSELERTLMQLLWEHQQGTFLGTLLFAGVPAERMASEVQYAAVIRNQARAEAQRSLLDHGIVSGKEDRNVLVDKRALEELLPATNGEAVAGILEGVTIDRAGNFSCPVASGMVFAASMKCRGSPDPSRIAETAALEFADMLTSEACSSFNNAAAVEDLLFRYENGALPDILSCGSTAAGMWCEFDPEWQPPCTPQVQPVRPIAWFRFWTMPEALGYQKLRKIKAEAGSSLEEALEERDWALRPHSRSEQLQALIDSSWAALQLQELGDEATLGGTNHVVDGCWEGDADSPDRLLNISRLAFELQHPAACDAVVVKLIEPEDLMDVFNDDHPEPNVDAVYVGLKGRTVLLPLGVQLAR